MASKCKEKEKLYVAKIRTEKELRSVTMRGYCMDLNCFGKGKEQLRALRAVSKRKGDVQKCKGGA